MLVLFPRSSSTRPASSPASIALVKQHGYCSVVRVRGTATTADGTFLAEQGSARRTSVMRNSGGAAPVVAQMVKDALDHKFHWAVADYTAARGAPHRLGHRRDARPTSSGQRAVELALEGRNAVMPTIEHTSATCRMAYRTSASAPAGLGGQRREADAARLPFPGRRLRHYREMPSLPAALRLIEGEDYPAYRGGLPV